MEHRGTKYAEIAAPVGSFAVDDDARTEERLARLLDMNAETAREKALLRTERERLEAATMKWPLTSEQAFAYYGLILGSLVPAAIFIRFLLEIRTSAPDVIWMVMLMSFMNAGAAIGGYFSGKVVARIVNDLNVLSVAHSLLLLPFLGLIWGMIAGASGGVFFFVFGAVGGAVLGGAVGAVALPAFALLHRSLKRGDMIERSQYLPLAFGVTLTICSFILGL